MWVPNLLLTDVLERPPCLAIIGCAMACGGGLIEVALTY